MIHLSSGMLRSGTICDFDDGDGLLAWHVRGTASPLAAASQEFMEVTNRTVISPKQIDHNNHLNVRHYVGIFDDASWSFFASKGVTPRTYAEGGFHLVAAKQEITYLKEVRLGEMVEVISGISSLGRTSLVLVHSMRNCDTGEVVANMTIKCVCMDSRKRTSRPLDKALDSTSIEKLKKIVS